MEKLCCVSLEQDLDKYKKIKEDIRNKIIDYISKNNITKIITTGECGGACKIGREVAQELAIPLELHFLNKKRNQGMYDVRSKEIIKVAEHFLIFWDGNSKGTSNEIKDIEKANKKYILYKYNREDYEEEIDLDLDFNFNI